jgi:hypothetical protein
LLLNEAAHHPKVYESFSIPLQTLIIKDNLGEIKTGKPKSSKYHKMIYNKFVDDIFMFGRKQSVTSVDPCLKLYAGCPIINYGVNK